MSTSAVKIAFRADASLQMGTGHVMRCLTLADELANRGAECHFICREHHGHLAELIAARGHMLNLLPRGSDDVVDSMATAHGSWLGVAQIEDVKCCQPILHSLQPNWLVVDHYALDHEWHRRLKGSFGRLMVIDDLADRAHQCDLLLDQNLGRSSADYQNLVPSHCNVITGPDYALLRPEFAATREISLKRRPSARLRRILITMGGVDIPNATCEVLQALQTALLPKDCEITVVMGPTSPWLSQVRAVASTMHKRAQVFVGVSDMAGLMADCDLAIGAAGSTSWERCCLGLPTIVLILAENQRFISSQLDRAGAADAVNLSAGNFKCQMRKLIARYCVPGEIAQKSATAAAVCDGLGVQRVGNHLYG
nr:UDP-2,4-diacetamido-2,4,6-trideoxy-beta-L-altropyranose hydrolase [Stutzerimonas stutzeri]